jgi:D-ribose pyranose/furanose isomerase RbsD
LETLRSLQKSLSGTEDGSLLTQLRLLRQDSNDRLDVLKVTMAEALKKLSEMGSQALIEALRDVIRDFNDKITEQFGENFKQLNAAVGNLLVWQEQYKATIESTVTKLDAVSQLVGDLTASFSVVVERSERFASVADRLGAMLTALEGNESRLKEQSEALATLLLKASGSLPEIERKIEELSTQLANAVRDNQRIVGVALTEGAATLRDAVDVLRKDVSTVSTDLGGMVKKNQEAIGAALTENTAAIRTSLDAAQREMSASNTEFNRQLRELADKTKEQVATLDAALQRELEIALRSLAQQFTAISGRFAQDYGNVADTLKRIVESTRVS